VQISEQVHKEDLKGLIAFCEEHPDTQPIVVSLDSRPRVLQIEGNINITILPWNIFLEKLWKSELI